MSKSNTSTTIGIHDGSIITYWGTFWLIDKGRKDLLLVTELVQNGQTGLEFDSLPVGVDNGEFHYRCLHKRCC